jgi:hypothetical protein
LSFVAYTIVRTIVGRSGKSKEGGYLLDTVAIGKMSRESNYPDNGMCNDDMYEQPHRRGSSH